jgi:hypothetical protein
VFESVEEGGGGGAGDWGVGSVGLGAVFFFDAVGDCLVGCPADFGVGVVVGV